MKAYYDRRQAGQQLAQFLMNYKGQDNTLILALPRGGVPVAFEVALALSLPLDVLLVRKLGVPHQEEVAMGAIAFDDTCVFNRPIIDTLNIPQQDIEAEISKQKNILTERNKLYRHNQPPPKILDKTIILIDDGLATGATMRAAVNAVKTFNPKQIIVAVPVAAADTCQALAQEVDELVCPLKPTLFYAVGAWYQNFPQTTDEEVIDLLNRHALESVEVK